MNRARPLRIRVYEFLVLPAHAWLLVCAALLGIRIRFGPIDWVHLEDEPLRPTPKDTLRRRWRNSGG